MPTPTRGSYFNPFSSQHRDSVDRFHKLAAWQKVVVCIASFFAAIPTLGFGGVAAFRALVGRFSTELSGNVDKTASKVTKAATPPKVLLQPKSDYTCDSGTYGSADGRFLMTVDKGKAGAAFEITAQAFDPEDFTTWIYGNMPNANNHKHVPFQMILVPEAQEFKGQDISIKYTKNRVDVQIDAQSKHTNVNVECREEWYDYQDDGGVYVDFANATMHGGGWRGGSMVQEEKMFLESFKLALWAYSCEKLNIKATQGNTSIPFIVEDVSMDGKIADKYYGKAGVHAMKNAGIDALNEDETVRLYPKAERHSVHIAGIAAQKWRGKHSEYTHNDLKHHYTLFARSCHEACQLNPKNPVIHTSAWGCGDFWNSEKTIMALQMHAARHMGVKVIFHGVNNKFNPNYTEEYINGVATALVNNTPTPRDFIQKIVDLQITDTSWAPKRG